jgi:hypothetical protein
VIRRGLPLLVLVLLFVACNDDGSALETPTPSVTATASEGGRDADYVREFCAIDSAFGANLVAAAQELVARGLDSVTDPEVLTELVVPPLREYIDGLRRVNPPSDVRPYHEDLIEAMEAQVQLIETGGFDTDQLGTDPFADLVEPPPEIQARLAAIAAEAADCNGVSFFDS